MGASRSTNRKTSAETVAPVVDERSKSPLKSRARQQEAIAALGQLALASSDLDHLMREAVQRLADTLKLEFAAVLELEPDGKMLLVRAGVGWRVGVVGSARVSAEVAMRSGFTLLAGEPVVSADIRTERRFRSTPLLHEHGIVSGITIAIPGQLRPYGVLGVYSTHSREFTFDDVHFLRTVANVLAAAVKMRSAEQALRDGEARMRAVLNTLVDGIITIDETGKIESINPAGERLFGYTAEELVGKNVNTLMPEPFRSEHDGYLASYLTTGRAKIIGIGREVVGKRKDGAIFPMDLAVSQFRVGERRMFTGVVRDITERRRLEREILEAAAEEQRRIGQDLHDGLCQELAGIAFATEVLTQKLAGRSAPEVTGLAKVGELVDHAITQARDLARGLQPVTLEAGGLVAALEALAGKAEEMFHISCLFVCEPPCLVRDNPIAIHLYRIAQEAVSNAVKHGKAKTVVIDLNATDDELVLVVKDDGIGFGRATSDEQGMGIRSMQYRARAIGGTVTLRAGERGGTTVTCYVRNNAIQGKAREKPSHGKGNQGREAEDQNTRRGRSPHRPRAPGGTNQPGARP